VPAWMGRGFVWFQLENHEKAIADFSKVIEISPQSAQAYNNRGYNHQLLGNYSIALEDYNQALEIVPEFVLALQNKAWLLATVDDNAIRDGAEAIRAATKVCELSAYNSVGDLRALAAAFAADDQFDKAIGWQEKAVELAPANLKEHEMEMLNKYTSKEALRLDNFKPATNE